MIDAQSLDEIRYRLAMLEAGQPSLEQLESSMRTMRTYLRLAYEAAQAANNWELASTVNITALADGDIIPGTEFTKAQYLALRQARIDYLAFCAVVVADKVRVVQFYAN